MRIKRYLFLIFAVTVLAFGSWFVVLNNINPFKEGPKAVILFILLFMIWIWGIATFLNYYIRIWRANREIIYLNLLIAARQGIWIALGAGGLLTLKIMDVFNLLSATVYVFALILMELFFKNRTEIKQLRGLNAK